MTKAKRQLYILCDVEGASQISPANKQAMVHGSDLWAREGRGFVTSDLKAVCEAANEFGMDEIVINDEHDYGNKEPNILVSELPPNVRMVRRPHLPGTPRRMVQKDPFGMIIVGQHAMYGGGGFAPHTIQSPPIGEVTLNGIRVGEIGLALALFAGVRFLAIVGEEAATREAQQLCPNVVPIPVKSLERDWFPTAEETFPVIKEEIAHGLRQREHADALSFSPPYEYSMRPTEGYCFNPGGFGRMRAAMVYLFAHLFRGRITEEKATWETRSHGGGLYGLHFARQFIRKK
jgi:D-aminopeptidase